MSGPSHTVGSTATAGPRPAGRCVPAASHWPAGVTAPVTRVISARSETASSVEAAVNALADSRAVLVANDCGEVSIMAAAATANTSLLAFMVRHTSGFVCVALPEAECERLVLPPMQARSPGGGQADFRVTVDAACGIGTGISARDRARTAALLADPRSGPSDFSRPGHVVPVAARTGGVLEHPGDAEAAVDLAVLAGLAPAAVLARMVSPAAPERMATHQEVGDFGTDWGVPLVHVSALRAYRATSEASVTRMADTPLPMSAGAARAVGYRGSDGSEYLALVVGSVANRHAVATYVHYECLLGDVFGSLRCDCGHRLDGARRAIFSTGRGVLIYRRGAGAGARADHPRSEGVGDPEPYPDVVPEQILRDLGVLTSVPCMSPDAYRKRSTGPRRASGSHLAGGP